MKTNEAILYLAQTIWHDGESKGDKCLIPTGYSDVLTKPIPELHKASDVLFDQFAATHFRIKWLEKGKSVSVTLLGGDSFGACLNVKPVLEEIVFVD